ncbi:2-C-methyl-D-erythritol 4-phosphate cytidylyltransferase [Rhodocytophaga rosea]|uniref:2-C-methyl-D-erythritol 4-phosphate cytidylyltransferase n=1 Tax=Rhodocytophaga rosea TaxID=2704465 RepID=A0A6C0GRH2_9BACT|nr:2-C-methyl-D-erythritol 4-phosphate cytidylyltransferase [Rhodocytophaga rosea]QHT70090.1 2-C-methyl-D-erythritol 4-phosphate cytidylyltransferase [Rhodocytophaga rosea]
MDSNYAIIVAGGSGSRMQTFLPKQFIKIGSKPVLMHTIERFHQYSPQLHIILVLPSQEIQTWEELCDQYNFTIPVQTVAGGPTRFHSVQNGLSAISAEEGLVAVHDGVRPFVSIETISQSFAVAKEKGCAITMVPLKDSIRRIDPTGNNFSEDRRAFCLVQTPQTFRLSILRQSFAQATDSSRFTDDASVAEAAGYAISLIEGSYRNIKITTPEDLIWAEAVISMQGNN